MHVDVVVADESHAVYADEICEEVFISARERGTGIARSTPEYVQELGINLIDIKTLTKQ